MSKFLAAFCESNVTSIQRLYRCKANNSLRVQRACSQARLPEVSEVANCFPLLLEVNLTDGPENISISNIIQNIIMYIEKLYSKRNSCYIYMEVSWLLIK